MKSVSITFLIALFLLPLVSFADLQVLGGSGSSNNILITTDPTYPGPNQFVKVNLESYAIDLNRTEISWFINGQLEKEATGDKTLMFKTGPIGSSTNILVLIKDKNGQSYQQTLNINPANVDLIWEAQSYTPPFYKGKAIYPMQGSVKIVAVPNIVIGGVQESSKNLVYTWSIDGDAVSQTSGLGKNYMIYTGGTLPNTVKISVDVSTLDKKYNASKTISLAPQLPQLLFYENSPIYGIQYNRALSSNTVLSQSEISIVGIPYFIGTKEREGNNLKYEWRQNGNIVNSGNKSTLIFRQDKDTKGVSFVSLQISNPDKMFQMAANDISLSFGKTSEVQF
jgi:hypothetical protein